MSKNESGSVIFLIILLIAVIAGYQFISNLGQFIANSMSINLILFWALVFFVASVIAGFALGSDSIKKKLLGD